MAWEESRRSPEHHDLQRAWQKHGWSPGKQKPGPPPPDVSDLQPLDTSADLPLTEAGEAQAIGPCGLLSIACALFLPSTVMVGCFSAIGVGPEVVAAVASYGLQGNFSLAAALFLVVLYYALDWPSWGCRGQALSLAVPWCLVGLGLVLKMSHTPSYAMALTVFHIAVFLGILRSTTCQRVDRRQFYMAVACASVACAVVSAAMWLVWWNDGNQWNEKTRMGLAVRAANLYEHAYRPTRFAARPLNYTADCGQSKDTAAFSSEEQAAITKACANAATVLYVMWAGPLVVTIASLVIAVFVYITGVVTQLEKTIGIERLLKLWVFGLVLVGMCNYASASYFSGVSLRLSKTLLSFFAVAFVTLLAWAYLEHHSAIIAYGADATHASRRFIRYVPPWAWNVMHGMLIGGLNVLIPAFLLADMARARILRCRAGKDGTADAEDPCPSRFTPHGRRIVREMQAWRWANALWWVCTLGHVYFMWQVGVAKATYIFLSWLNEQLSNMPYGQVIIINFVTGIIMFLLPPVPGVAVYLFTGIVVAEQGRQKPSVGFARGCVIAIVLCFFLKMMACCAQYALGYFMGQSVRVQALVGVDKIFTRAMEEILKKPGLSLGKVSVLVGGPDWPVSVGCGILQVPVLQMLLGTSPVFFVLSPCVLAGAFQARVGVSEGPFFSTGATMLISASVLIQVSTALVAVMYVMNVVGTSGEQLAKPRPEHKAVQELAQKEESYNRAFRKVTEWQNLSVAQRALISLAATFAVVSGAIFALYGSSCFENFSISSKIGDPIDENGLAGDVYNIVIFPQGLVPLVLYFASAVLHVLFMIECARMTRIEIASEVVATRSNAVAPDLIGNQGENLKPVNPAVIDTW